MMIDWLWLLVGIGIGVVIGGAIAWPLGYITRGLLERADTGTPADGEDET